VVNKELIINAGSSEVNIALLEEKVLVELNKEKTNNSFAVGDVYLGRIKKIMPGLNAAFVDVGYEKDAFLHYLDLGPQINSFQKYTRNALILKKQVKFHRYFRQISISLYKLPRSLSLPKGLAFHPKFHLQAVTWCWCHSATGFLFRKR
jgi:Ribonuclease G/E